MLSYESYLTLIRQVDELVELFEQHPDPATRERLTALLSGLDALHREGITRLVKMLREAGAGPAVEQAVADPVVEILLGLYDVVELDLPEEPEQAAVATTFVPIENLTFRRKAAGGEQANSTEKGGEA